jgi:hypothetical protein
MQERIGNSVHMARLDLKYVYVVENAQGPEGSSICVWNVQTQEVERRMQASPQHFNDL